jgi:serine/threonine protein kinase
MAPEVILRSSYSTPADIWSLGITCFELALGKPPRSNIHPMRVLFMIPQQDPPKLEGEFSHEFRDFVALCLRKRARERPTAQELLSHPFIRMYANKPMEGFRDDVIVPYMRWKEINHQNTPENPLQKTADVPDGGSWDFGTVKSCLKGSSMKSSLKSGIAFADEFDSLQYVANNTRPIQTVMPSVLAKSPDDDLRKKERNDIEASFVRFRETHGETAAQYLITRLQSNITAPVHVKERNLEKSPVVPTSQIHQKLIQRWRTKKL